MSRTLMLQTTTPEAFVNIHNGIQATTLILRSYRVELLTASATVFRELGISIGGIVSSNNQMGNVQHIPVLTIDLDKPAAGINIGGTVVDLTFVPYCHHPLTMSGDLPAQFTFKVFFLNSATGRFQPLHPNDLKYLRLTFEVT